MPAEDHHPRGAEAGSDAPEAAESPSALAQGLPAVAPDVIEEVNADEIDNIVPTHGYHQMPVVALGGSAGSIQALRAFFEALPAETGMAYVVILHLAPDHTSTLPELLQQKTAMPVRAAQDAERLEADHVYVIPPGKHLLVVNGHLRLTTLEPERGKRVAVDVFFRTLADTHGPHATAVVLSGADSDGANGIKRIKERGGLTVAQEPEEAEHPSMPSTAIGTGMVDWVLRVAEMPARIVEYRANAAALRLPSEDGPQPAKPVVSVPDGDEAALREVLAFLRARTSHDFTYYKRATIVRRISRRMQINGLTNLPDYVSFLRTHPGEAGALLGDLLISVTNFFRDRDTFAALERDIIPSLFVGKGLEDIVRVWCAACATGEEAYSMAMLLTEHARTLEHPPSIQVFACDLDGAAIAQARAGVYALSIVADVSEERLQRFFVKDARGYRVRRDLREMVLFAEHDLLKDAPFSKLDLASCRNLLIYLNREAQNRALEIFHFALKPQGKLFLGNSESVPDESELFQIVDKKHRFYVRRTVPRASLPVPNGTGTLQRTLHAKQTPVLPGPIFGRMAGAAIPPASDLSPPDERAALTDLHFQLIERHAPPSVVVNEHHDIVHFSENASRFMQAIGGQPTTSLLRSVHPTLRAELRGALFRAVETHAPVEVFSVPMALEGVSRMVDLRVAPAAELAPGYLLVSFTARDPDPAAANGIVPPRLETETVVRHLEQEVEHVRGQLRDTVERYEASAEEYKSSHEELQSMNEELRSASEELETSREELQSINEELTTVNSELKSNVEELGRSNSDLHNLMNATNIITVFLDRELNVTRFTPNAAELFFLISTDVGRPLEHVKLRLDYPDLIADARKVLRTLVPIEREVDGTADQHWFLVRLQPYRTVEDRIGGVVLTFVEITERRRAEGALRKSEEKYRALFASIEQGFVLVEAILDAAGKVTDYRYLETNPAVEGMHGLANLTGTLFSELAPDFESHWTEPADHVLRTGERACMENYHRALGRWYRVHYSAVGDPANRILGLLFEDITERKRRESDLAFLAEISQDLAHLTNIDETMNALGAKMGAHLGLSACIFGELFGENEAQTAELTHGWHRANTPSLLGTYQMSEYMTLEMIRMCRAAEPIVIRDVFADPKTDGEQFAKLNIGSFVGMPLVRGGEWRFLLVVYRSEPHDWSEEEVALVRELAARIWTRLERARAEEALRASEAHTRALAENMPGGAAFIFDRDLRYVLADGEALHAVGFQTEDFVGKTLREALEPALVSLYEPALRGALAGEPFTLEHASHGRVFVSRGTPLREAGRGEVHAVVVVSYDITERKQAADALERTGEQLRVALADAESAGRAKDHFLAVLSHELRTPLMPITMALASLARRQDVPEPIRKAHEMIGRNVELEARFIDDMLDVTRITRGKMEIVRKDMDLHEAVRRAVEVVTSDIEAKDQRLTVTMEEKECRLNGDFARLQQVIWNLLKNASKFTPRGGVIEIRSHCPDDEHHTVEVIDTGIGLEAEAAERIFNAFEQASASITREFGGLGLGLAIAKATVEAHGGTLRASSPGPGQGATFSVNLPYAALPTVAAGTSV